MLSIIIPALNEEKRLPLLLDSIRKQSFSDYEIIVSDGGSSDKTVEIAKSYGAKIVGGGSPAGGRNEGAKVAQGDLLMFLDADCLLPPPDFLDKIINEFQERKLAVATCLINPFGRSKITKINYELLFNLPSLLFERIFPNGTGLWLIRRDIHREIGGVNEEIKIGEDHEYLRRASRKGKYGALRSKRFLFSERRFEEEGWIKNILKYFLVQLHVLFWGPVRSDIFKYKFGEHKNKKIK